MLTLLLATAVSLAGPPADAVPSPPTSAEVLEAASASDWHPVPAADLLILDVDGKRVTIELAPAFAPLAAANVRSLVAERYFDGLGIIRSQDNYVVQWADPQEGSPEARSLGSAAKKVPGEYTRPRAGLAFAPLASTDAYAPQVGFVDGFAVGSDGERAWLTHCYGAVGVARDVASDSGNGSSLYVVIGHAPRHLDANITVLGRVIEGMEVLSVIRRGSGAMGFFAEGEAPIPIRSARLASELPEAERPTWMRLRTDTPTFEALVRSKRERHETWFAHPVGAIGLCNVPLPRRQVAPASD